MTAAVEMRLPGIALATCARCGAPVCLTQVITMQMPDEELPDRYCPGCADAVPRPRRRP